MVKILILQSAKRSIYTMVGLGVLLFSEMAVCEGFSPLGSKPGWIIAPYMWMPDLDGDVGMGPLSVPLDLSAKDLAGGLDAAAMGYLRFGNQRQFVYFEGLGLRFRDDKFEPFFDQAIDSKLVLAEIGYGRHYYITTGFPTASETRISPYVGLRYSLLDVKISNPAMRTKADENWLDVATGIIVEGPVRERFSYFIKLDGAGFDLDKSHYWSASTGLLYYVNPRLSLGAGYRWAEFDAQPGDGNILKMTLRAKGPQVGMVYLFGADHPVKQ